MVFALLKFGPWLAVATHLVRNKGAASASVDWSGGFEARALQEVPSISIDKCSIGQNYYLSENPTYHT